MNNPDLDPAKVRFRNPVPGRNESACRETRIEWKKVNHGGKVSSKKHFSVRIYIHIYAYRYILSIVSIYIYIFFGFPILGVTRCAAVVEDRFCMKPACPAVVSSWRSSPAEPQASDAMELRIVGVNLTNNLHGVP